MIHLGFPGNPTELLEALVVHYPLAASEYQHPIFSTSKHGNKTGT
jgi:hypothetical protein